ncbi:Sec61beta family-domain-containing protein [Lentinula lateritia]|uniref:Sec61beta family-domain-containing protein n=1 Tax=Lentinula lateritia TaxID=40482 RepID=A0ABQ8VUC3_9AGAR|nr:Sec61beta family-domain-containing protein [Lentinula lateritia]
MSDSDSSRSPTIRSTTSSVAKPPGAQIRCVKDYFITMWYPYLLLLCRRRATGNQAAKPNSSRAAGAGGSSNTMLKLYTDDSPGLRVDPFIVLVLSLVFIGSIFFLHISAKVIRMFTK